MTHNNLLNQFKKHFSKTHSSLDFRSDVYAPNSYGLSPCISYDRAKEIVLEIYSWADDYLADNEESYPDFRGWVFNLDMTIDSLRMSTIKQLIDDIIDDLVINYKETLPFSQFKTKVDSFKNVTLDELGFPGLSEDEILVVCDGIAHENDEYLVVYKAYDKEADENIILYETSVGCYGVVQNVSHKNNLLMADWGLKYISDIRSQNIINNEWYIAIIEHCEYEENEWWTEIQWKLFSNNLEWNVVIYNDGAVKLQHDSSLSSFLECGQDKEDFGIEDIQSCWNFEDLRED